MIELAIKNMNKYYGATKVFDDINLELRSKERIGLIGRNGTGKTTLFKIISGKENYHEGQLTYKKGSTIGYLDQMPDYPELKAKDVLNLAFESLIEMERHLKVLEEKLETSNDTKYLEDYGTLQQHFEVLGGYKMNEQIDRICSGFKLDTAFLNQPFDSLSGGEKTRIMLAKILLEQPSILLLDEPTNHLDLESVEWLEAYLKSYEGSVLIVSHDRYFLDAVVHKIVEIDGGTTHLYHGHYSYYIEEKERRLLEQIELYDQQQKKIKSMEEAIKRFRDWGTRADNKKMFIKAKQFERRIDKMEKLNRPNHHKKMALSFNESKRSGKEVVCIRELTKSFSDKILIQKSDMDVRYQDFVALLGKNGSGKTTLFKMILGEELPDSGTIKVSNSIKIGYMKQEIVFEQPEKTILEGFKDAFALTELEARRKLARFLFFADDVFKVINHLSGGEKVRLSLCMMMEEAINFLILDEPTNHVDIDSREMIEQALQNFGGTILFISHDRYFIDQLATKIIHIENQELVTYSGNYAYFKMEQEKKRVDVESEPEKVTKVKEKTVSNKPNKFKQEALKRLEEEINILEEEIAAIEEEMIQQGDDYETLMTLSENIKEKRIKLEELMEKWMSDQ